MVPLIKFAVLLAFGGILFLACTTNRASGPKGTRIADSQKYEATLFRQNCAICHGPEGHGKTVNGTRVPSLRIGDAAKRSEDEIYSQISNGKLPMPSFRDQLTVSEIQKMAKFVKEDLQGRTVRE
ncbi:MAG: cytochrome c [Acidobacteriota bacterium]|nr:cytochrome c [Acidobacteriota bacterium]MDH3529418.1 cytochrome c [Acidobacteriota bacterium]